MRIHIWVVLSPDRPDSFQGLLPRVPASIFDTGEVLSMAEPSLAHKLVTKTSSVVG